ncbi:MAG: hypothetical protein EAX96_09890 [Candidatus Lokiarchaeota archaeon]|nr:hypothetical protein [Candidatus Lokiarchaeota archaeon]
MAYIKDVLQICPYFERTEPIIEGLNKFSIDKLIIIYDPDLERKTGENIEILRKEARNRKLKLEDYSVNAYNMIEICQLTKNIIDSHPNYEIFINLTSGRKTQVFGVWFGAIQRRKRIVKIIYQIQESRKFIEIPIIKWDIGEKKEKILRFFNENEQINYQKLKEQLKIDKGQINKYVRSLIDENFLKKGDSKGKYILLKKSNLLINNNINKFEDVEFPSLSLNAIEIFNDLQIELQKNLKKIKLGSNEKAIFQEIKNFKRKFKEKLKTDHF